MTIVWALILLLVMPVCSIGPGYVLARRLRLGAGEKLCASIGLSILFIYLAATVLYFLPVPWSLAWVVTGISGVITWSVRRDLLSLLRKRHIHRQIAAFAFLLIIGLLLAAILRHFSGGAWSGDWLEHYQRAIFFLDRLPVDTPFITLYALPARPPLMNLVAAYFLGHTSTASYALFQIVFLYLGLLICFPCVLLAGHLVPFGSRRVSMIAAMLALSPFVMQNATYTWTKLFSAFYVLVALAFYLRAWRKDDPKRMVLAALMMAGGMLVHYSAGPFAVVIALHYLLIARRRSHALKEIAGSIVVGGLVLFSWLGWSMAIYGWNTTIASNTSVTDAAQLSRSQNLVKIGQNIFHTFVPWPLRNGPEAFRYEFDQPNPFGALRDFAFLHYQHNALLSLGLIGWIGAACIARNRLKHASPDLRRFWVLFLVISTVLAIAVTGGLEHYGLTPIVLQPTVLIGLTLLAAGMARLPTWARGTLVLFLAIDALLGILLQYRMQMHDFRLLPPDHPPIAQTVPFTPGLLGVIAIWNSVLRHRMQTEYLADALVAAAPALYIVSSIYIGIAIVIVARSSRIGVAWTIAILAIFLGGSTLLMSDRAMGYGSTPPAEALHPLMLSAEQIRDRLAPYERAVMEQPDSSEAHYRLGRARYDLRQLEPAAASLIEACLLDPFAIEPRYLLRVLLLSHGGFLEETDAWAAELYRRNPTDAEAIRNLAAKLEQHGHSAPASSAR